MLCMGQDQSKGMELEDKVVESQPQGVTRTRKVPQICLNVVLTRTEFEAFRHSKFWEHFIRRANAVSQPSSSRIKFISHVGRVFTAPLEDV